MTTLAELRQASLKEQKQKEQTHTEDTPPVEEPAVMPRVAETVLPKNGANGHYSAAHAPAPAAAVAEPTPEELREAQFFSRLREALAHKTLHPSGAKVSADMAPALFHRAKRYCLDHGNITMRQVLIELLSAYLEEEGY